MAPKTSTETAMRRQISDAGWFFGLVGREIRLGWGRAGGAILPAAFFLGAIMAAPFAIGPEPQKLAAIGPGFVWVALALASLVSLDRLYQADLEDGALDHFLIATDFPALIAASKALGNWIVVTVPIFLALPLASISMKVPQSVLLAFMAQILIGSLGLYSFGMMASALGASVRRGALLVALLAIPLYAPVLVFGAAAAEALSKNHQFLSQPFLLLCALTLASMVFSPWAAGAALKLSVD